MGAVAERALERIVASKPTYKVTDADVSPRLVAIFAEVRKRSLPGVARKLYQHGRDAFAEKEYAEARDTFAALLALLKDDDLASQNDVADLQMLADGFLRLTEAALEPVAGFENEPLIRVSGALVPVSRRHAVLDSVAAAAGRLADDGI